MGRGVEDSDGNGLSDQSFRSIKDHDSIAMGSAGQLDGRARIQFVRSGFLAGTLHQHFDLAAEKFLVVFFADLILDSQQMSIPLAFDFEGTSSGRLSAARVPGRSLYLKMKLFLNRHS